MEQAKEKAEEFKEKIEEAQRNVENIKKTKEMVESGHADPSIIDSWKKQMAHITDKDIQNEDNRLQEMKHNIQNSIEGYMEEIRRNDTSIRILKEQIDMLNAKSDEIRMKIAQLEDEKTKIQNNFDILQYSFAMWENPEFLEHVKEQYKEWKKGQN